MRRSLAIPLLGLWIAATPAGAALIYNETFDTNGSGTRYTVTGGGIAPGNQDYWTRSSGTINPFGAGSGFQGTNYFAGRDLDENIGGTNTIPRAVQTTSGSAVSIAGYTALTMSILLAANTNAWESNQADSIRLYMVNYSAGGALTLLDTFLPTGLVDTNLRSTVFGTSLGTTFTRYTYNLPITIGNIGFRLEASSTGDLEFIGFDDIRIEGTPVPEPSSGALVALGLLVIGASARRARTRSLTA
jgi:hypothetical protein